MNRRQFLKTAAAGAGSILLPSGARAGKNAPGNKLNVALIGVWGRGLAHYDSLAERERRRPVRREREATSRRRQAVPQGQDLRRLAQVPRPKGPRRRGLLHGRPHARLHRQLGAEPRPARVLREAAGQHRRRGPRRAGQLAEEEGQAGHAGRHAAARDPEFQPRARADPRRRHRRAEGGLRLGQPPDSPARLPARRGRAAGGLPLRSVARARRPMHPYNPGYFSGGAGHELPVVEHVLGLRQRPDRRHGQPHDGPALERRRRRPADLRRGQGRGVQSRRHAGRPASRTSSTRPTTGAARSA